MTMKTGYLHVPETEEQSKCSLRKHNL